MEWLRQIRRRNKRTRDDMYNEILQASTAPHCDHRTWRMNIAYSLDKERVERRKAQESQQQKEKELHQDIMGPSKQQTQML
ncbi:unnamed protein product [Caretta caretta]